MKSLMLTLCIGILSVTTVLAQIKIEIKEETKAMSKGSYNALVMELPGTNSKDVGKNWKKFSKKLKGKTRYDRKVNEYFTDDATIEDMSDNTIDIVAKVEERGAEGTAISVWFNLGVSYLSSNEYPDRYPAAENLLKKFANEVSAEMILEELKVQEKLLKEKEKEKDKLEKDKENLEKDIEDYKETIRKMEENIKQAEADITKNEKDQEGKATEIEEQKKIVEEIKARLESVK